MKRFEDKVVLIVGAGDVAVAAGRKSMKEGAKVAFADFSEKALRAAAAAMEEAGFDPADVMTATCDVRSQESCDRVVEQVLARWGRIDTMLETAGIIRHMPIYEMGEQDWQDVIDINLTGVFHACKAVVPSMMERKHGHIVIISSVGGRTGRKGVGCNYAASKAGVNGIVINLAMNLAPYGINVNSIAPGPLKGRMFDSMSEENKKNLAAGIPMGTVGELEDIANAFAYLGSDEASWTTGEVLDVNGGIYY